MTRIFNAPLIINEAHRDGLIAITEDGIVEAYCDVGKGCPASNVNQNVSYLRNQRHKPRICVECNAATAEKLSGAAFVRPQIGGDDLL